MPRACQVCGSEISAGDYCLTCLELKVAEFKKNWRWKTPQNQRCKSEIDGERCPFLAAENSEYCPPCRNRYDTAIRCEHVSLTGKRCTQFKQKGEKYCWTHLRHLEKLHEGETKERLNHILNKIKAGRIEETAYEEIVELVVSGHIDTQAALVIVVAKFADEFSHRGGSSNGREGTPEA